MVKFFMIKTLKYLILLFLAFGFFGCSNNNDETYEIEYSQESPFTKKTYTFGVHPLHNPQKLFEVYQPLVDYINSRLMEARIKLEASRNYAAYDEKLFNGYFDLALPNPYQTVVAAQKDYIIFGKMGDDENFRGIFIARKDSNITSVNDIKNKTVSYPAPTALAATMMPQYYLHENGIDINKDIKNSYVGSQESSIMNVYLKKSIVGSTWPPPWLAFVKDHPKVASELEIVWETKPLLNNALIARKDFPEDLLNQISDIVFTLHTHEKGKEILQRMELSKYEKADSRTYDEVNNFIKKFENEIRPVRLNK